MEKIRLSSANPLKNEAASTAFQTIAAIPQITGAAGEVRDNLLSLTLSTVQRDYTRKTKVMKSFNQLFDLNSKKLVHQFEANEVDDTIGLTSLSPKNKTRCILKTVGDKRFVAITDGIGSFSIEVTKAHGGFYNDEYVGHIAWNNDETQLIYVAEISKREEVDDLKYLLQDQMDLGEGYTGKRKPVLVIANLVKRSVRVLDELPGLSAVSHPLFSPSSSELIYFIGILEVPTLYGAKYCTNRNTSLHSVNTDGSNLKKLGADGRSNRFPILSPNRKFLLYLSNEIGGPHDSCAKLISFEIESGNEETIVEVVDSAKTGCFTGLFSVSLKDDCWVKNNAGEDILLINSTWRSRSAIIAVNTLTKRVEILTASGTESWSVSFASKNQIVALRSSINHPAQVYTKKLGSEPWTLVASPVISSDLTAILSGISYSIHSIPGRSDNVEVISVVSTEAGDVRKKDGLAPLIVMEHGGPHGCLTTSFSLAISAFVSLGYYLLLVNYSGSTGFGNNSINELLGNIGKLDVDDVHAAALWGSKQAGVDSKRVFLFGGSHGGFINAHLIQKEAEFYTGAVIRNPVINIGSMPYNSDIPDWCFGEAKVNLDLNKPVFSRPNDYKVLYECSPIKYSDEGKKASSVLLHVGSVDRRVPPSQGLRWAESLKANGNDVTVMLFQNNSHPLDSFDAERVGFESAAAFYFNLL